MPLEDEMSKQYTPEEIAACRAAQASHGMQMMAAHPGDPDTSALARRVMTQDPTELLDAVEAQKNPTPF